MDELLTDLIPFNGDADALLLWDNFTVPTINTLHRLLKRKTSNSGWINGISYRNLEGLRTSDLTDYSYIDERERNQILFELKEIFSVLETDGFEESLDSYIDPNYLTKFPSDAIDAAQNLEDLVAAILDEFNDYLEIDDRTLAILRGRVPAFLSSMRTLEEIGIQFNVTRERIRQIESKYQGLQLATAKNSNAFLDKLVILLESSLNQEAFVDSVTRANLLGHEIITIAKLKAIMEILGLEDLIVRVENVETNMDSYSLARGALGSLARSERNKFGLIDLQVFAAGTRTSNEEAYAAIMDEYPRSIKKGNLVLARTLNLDTAFENAIGKQLMVFGELDADALLVGVERQAAYRQVSILGSNFEQISLIMEIAGDSPNYETFKREAKSEPELSPTDEWFLGLFQESPTGMLHRNEISASAIRDGKNLASISVFLLFNVFIRPVGAAVMTLANVKIEPDDAQRYAVIARAIQERTQLEFSFSGSDILLRIIPNVNTMAAGVLFPSVELKDMIKDTVFKVVCECGKMNSIQELKLRPPNFWTGFTASIKHFMDYHHFAKDDELSILLNFESKIATCQVL